MTTSEWTILVKGLKSSYTSTFFLPDEDAVKVWYQLLKDLDYRQLNDAIMYWIQTEKNPPTIADLRGRVRENQTVAEDWSKGWEDVKKAVQRYGYYNPEDGLASLTGTTQEAAKRFGWSQLCMMETDREEVNRAQWRDIFNAIKVQRSRSEQISPALLERLNDVKRLTGS